MRPRFVHTVTHAPINSGEKEIPEVELDHLEGHKKSRPVRIGNGAADHVQLVRIQRCDNLRLRRNVISFVQGYLRRAVMRTPSAILPIY